MTGEAANENPPCETSYRRGYSHGYHQALEDLASAIKPLDNDKLSEGYHAVARFYENRVVQWRRGPFTDRQQPPQFELWRWKVNEE